MMRFSAFAICLATSYLLSGCVPYAGHTAKKEECIGWQSADPISLMILFAEDKRECRPNSRLPKEPAPDSSKRQIYTEEQRLKMAEAAARILYPMNKHRFRIADSMAELIVGSMFPDGHAAYSNCNKMATVRDFAVYLQDKLPEDALYKDVASEWSRLYSDKQLSAIYDTAKEKGKITSWLNDSLYPQKTFGMTLEGVTYKFELAFWKDNKNKFEPVVRRIHNAIVAEKRFVSTKCSKNFAKSATGFFEYYEFREFIFNPATLETKVRDVPPASPRI